MEKNIFHKIGIVLLIYFGTVCYTIAAYFHLYLKDKWTLQRALVIAIPFVLIEYLFSLNGNHYALKVLNWSPLQILVVTTAFYFVNILILNKVVIKHETKMLREFTAIVLVLIAFLVSGVLE